MAETISSPAILRRKQVEARTGLPRSSIYALMKSSAFPKPIKLGAGARAVGWVESEVIDWLSAQIEQSRKA